MAVLWRSWSDPLLVVPFTTGTVAGTPLRRMDHVFRVAPIRQWVLSSPFAMRYKMAYDSRLMSDVLNIFARGYRLPYDWITQIERPKERAVVPPPLANFRVPLAQSRSHLPLNNRVRSCRDFKSGSAIRCGRFIEGLRLNPLRCIEAVDRFQVASRQDL